LKYQKDTHDDASKMINELQIVVGLPPEKIEVDESWRLNGLVDVGVNPL